MPVLFGACGGVVSPGHEPYSRALRGYPGVRDVGRFIDDDYFVASARDDAATTEGGPYTCGGDRYVLALEGWLANRGELAQSLGLGGDSFADKVIVASALLRWGRDALPRLHGDFAIAWWDRVERRLLLATDRTGGRVLFYHETPGRLFFANLTAPLFMHPDVPRVLDPAMVARATHTASLDLESTCFQGIKQLLPAHLLEWTAANVRISRYWQLDPGRRIRLRRDDDYVDAARELLDRVVREALPRRGAAVSMLSGGLDSSGVAATLARLTAPERLHTITMRPDPASALPACARHQFQDEWGLARASAALHPSITAHGVPAALPSLEEIMRSSFLWGGRPPVHLMAAAWFAEGWKRARELGATTVFVGLSGNATLSGSSLPNGLTPRVRELPHALYTAVLGVSQGRKILPYLRAMTPEWVRDLKARFLDIPPERRHATALRRETAERLDVAQLWQSYVVGDHRAAWRQRARLRLIERTWVGRTLSSCQHFRDGIERRDPLGDVRLAEFCLAIPADQFTRFGQDRFLARRVLADRLPAQVLGERRDGRQGAEWFDWATRSRAWLASELDGIEASSLGREMIDVPRLRAILDDWPLDADSAEPLYGQLMNVLGRGVAVGSFIRWAEGGNS